MGVIGDFTVPAESFALQQALAANPEMIVTADRIASHSTEQVLPFLWASGGDFDAFHEAMDADPSVQRTTVAERADDSALYKVIWGRGGRRVDKQDGGHARRHRRSGGTCGDLATQAPIHRGRAGHVVPGALL